MGIPLDLGAHSAAIRDEPERGPHGSSTDHEKQAEECTRHMDKSFRVPFEHDNEHTGAGSHARQPVPVPAVDLETGEHQMDRNPNKNDRRICE